MLTLKGSILGIAVFFIGAVLLGLLKMHQVDSAFHRSHPGTQGQVGWDLMTMYHNGPLHRMPMFWITLIVFMAIGSWLVRLFSTH